MVTHLPKQIMVVIHLLLLPIMGVLGDASHDDSFARKQQLMYRRTPFFWPELDLDILPDLRPGMSDVVPPAKIADLNPPLLSLNTGFHNRSPDRNTPDFATNVSASCKRDFTRFLVGLQNEEEWALKLKDANGRPPSGMYQGPLSWPGAFTQCVETVSPMLTTKWRISGQYCSTELFITIGNFTPPVTSGLHIGLCVPAACSSGDLMALIQSGAYNVPDDPVYGVRRIDCKKNKVPLDASAIGVICMLSIIGAFLLAATLYDILFCQLEFQKAIKKHGFLKRRLSYRIQNQIVDMKNKDISIIETDVNSTGEKVPPKDPIGLPYESKNPKTNMEPENRERDTHIGIIGRLLLAVSVYSNGRKLLNSSQSADSLTSLNGIRAITMTWIILGHTTTATVFRIKNAVVINKLVRRFSIEVLLNATVSVDTFFLLSGMLVTYLTMKELKKRGGPLKLNWFLFYFLRIWRLTPPYMLILGSYTALFRYMGAGPSFPQAMNSACRQKWYLNLLFVNNLVSTKKMCMRLTWYLANDMQFYVISPLLLIPLYLCWKAGVAVVMAVMLASCIATGIISYDNNMVPFDGPNHWTHLYIVPWTRICPYLVGMLLGYLLFKTNRKIRFNKFFLLLGWLVAAGCCIAVLYGLHGWRQGRYEISRGVAALYNAVARTVWSLGVAWVVLVCATGHGGIVNRFLSWAPFTFLSRLSFMIYLTHTIVLKFYFTNRESLIFLTDLNFIYLYLASTVLSCMFGFASSLALEMPWMGLLRVLIHR